MTYDPQPGSSWDAARKNPHRHAASDAANATAEAIITLLAAERKRSITIQWMPDEVDKGCHFEVIGVKSGNYLAIADVAEDGTVRLRDGV